MFFFDPSSGIPPGKTQLAAKAFLDPAQGWIAGFNAGACLLKQAAITPKDKVHPSQAFVEIYVSLMPTPNPGLLEMEFHGEYRTLQPKETLAFEETWKILPYAGPDTADGHIAFLKAQGLLTGR